MSTIRLSADQMTATIPPTKAVRVRGIKPCPFCGAKAVPYTWVTRHDHMKIQHAPKCYFVGAHLFVENDDRINNDQIAKWNRRAKKGGKG